MKSSDAINITEVLSRNAKSCDHFADLDPLIEKIGNAKIVMLGEASHGTHEYYTWRAQITKRLLAEKDFAFVAVEGDWPDCNTINRYIKGYEPTASGAYNLLHGFNRWPSWMWANLEITELAEWLKNHNAKRQSVKNVGFFGLDVYSLWESMEWIIGYLRKHDMKTLKLAEQAFQCFMPYRSGDGQSYATASRIVPKLCEDEVVAMLKGIFNHSPHYNTNLENVFNAQQNATIAVNAEKYYRAMVRGGAQSWNIRDRHMQDTLERLLDFHASSGGGIVWAHNTHIGDARATDMRANGMVNIGELARTKYGSENVALVGFGSYSGTVIAGDSWGAPMQKMRMPAAMEGSWEYYLHHSGSGNKLLFMDDLEYEQVLDRPIGHRAIGVVYHPWHERYGNYVPSVLPKRYDAFIYLEKTSALFPIHNTVDTDQLPETYPSGM